MGTWKNIFGVYVSVGSRDSPEELYERRKVGIIYM
jgi:hypothetical protein